MTRLLRWSSGHLVLAGGGAPLHFFNTRRGFDCDAVPLWETLALRARRLGLPNLLPTAEPFMGMGDLMAPILGWHVATAPGRRRSVVSLGSVFCPEFEALRALVDDDDRVDFTVVLDNEMTARETEVLHTELLPDPTPAWSCLVRDRMDAVQAAVRSGAVLHANLLWTLGDVRRTIDAMLSATLSGHGSAALIALRVASGDGFEATAMDRASGPVPGLPELARDLTGVGWQVAYRDLGALDQEFLIGMPPHRIVLLHLVDGDGDRHPPGFLPIDGAPRGGLPALAAQGGATTNLRRLLSDVGRLRSTMDVDDWIARISDGRDQDEPLDTGAFATPLPGYADAGTLAPTMSDEARTRFHAEALSFPNAGLNSRASLIKLACKAQTMDFARAVTTLALTEAATQPDGLADLRHCLKAVGAPPLEHLIDAEALRLLGVRLIASAPSDADRDALIALCFGSGTMATAATADGGA